MNKRQKNGTENGRLRLNERFVELNFLSLTNALVDWMMLLYNWFNVSTLVELVLFQIKNKNSETSYSFHLFIYLFALILESEEDYMKAGIKHKEKRWKC